MKHIRQIKDKTDIFSAEVYERVAGEDAWGVAQMVILELLGKIEAGEVVFRIPEEVVGEAPKEQYKHLGHELFVQIAGYTDFTCGYKTFRLNPGEVCVMPRGMPHGERVGKVKGRDFCNLVIACGYPRGSFHFAELGDMGKPRVKRTGSIDYSATTSKTVYLDELVRLSREPSLVQSAAVKGLQLVYFSDLWAMLERRDMASVEPFKVSRVRQMVSSRLASPELCVEWLAEILRCHADYLSHLFKRETGMTLTRYINEQRVYQARDMLEKTALSVKEIAVAVGYTDPGYFARVFRQLTMDSPATYRVNRGGRSAARPHS